MKRTILMALSLTLALVFSLIGGASAVSAASENLVMNGDFSTGDFTGWTTFVTDNGTINRTIGESAGDPNLPAVTSFRLPVTDSSSPPYTAATFMATRNTTTVTTWEGGGIYQNFSAPEGTWVVSSDIAAKCLYAVVNGRPFPFHLVDQPKIELLIDGQVVDSYTFPDVNYLYASYGKLYAEGSFDEPGIHEIRIKITQQSTTPTYQFVDNVKFQMTPFVDGQSVWEYGGHYYQVIPGAITWDQANTAADKGVIIDGTYYRGHLAAITSPEENEFVYYLLTEKVGSGGRGWIGGFQLPDQSGVSEGWQWVIGEEMSYTNWDPAYADSPIASPNDAGGPLSGNPPTTEIPNPDYYGLEDNGENFMEMRGYGYWDDLGGTVTNSSYVIEFEPVTITGPIGPVVVGNSTDFSAPIFNNISNTATWDWGDGSVPEVSAATTGLVTGSHTYAAPGIYTVRLNVTDSNDDVGTANFQYVVVYDPTGGFVTGGGWIDSPAGAYTADPDLTGKANFGFVSKYQKGATVPSGNTEFQFKAGNLNFKSSSYEWLVIAGARAQFKGEGTINGAGSYGFMLTAIDGQVSGGGGSDKFRIKIWDGDGVVYDNQMGDLDEADPSTLLGGGSIVIHK